VRLSAGADGHAVGIQGVNDRLRLAELLTSRLCHDISGPVGTLMGALGMARENPGSAGEALDLAGDVAVSLGRRVHLVRAAWGAAVSTVSVVAVAGMCEGLPQAGRVKVSFEDLRPGGALCPEMTRLLLNVLILAGESMPRGGIVIVAGDISGAITVRLVGVGAAWPADFAGWMADARRAWAAVEGMTPEMARGLQGPLTALIGHAGGIRMGFLIARAAEEAPPLILTP